MSLVSSNGQDVKSTIFSPFWLVVWAIFLSLGWLLPNHYLPWPSFHLETWTATLLLVSGLVVLIRTSGSTPFYLSSCVVGVLIFMPAIQHTIGLQPLLGSAWVATAYLLGLLLAILVGGKFEMHSPGQLGDGLFLAVGIAAALSVGLQLHQWLMLDRLFLWDMGNPTTRPFANFGQPNLLATFLLWGVLACLWGFHRRYLQAHTAIFLAMYLLFGVALTGSRTAWISVVMLVLGTWYWRALMPSRRTVAVAILLAIYFCLCIFFKSWVRPLLGLGEIDDLTRLAGETRPQVWSMFLAAIKTQPWSGYGWGQIASAHLEVALDQKPLYMLFSHSHNLFLDLILWCGVPVGVVLVVVILVWAWTRFRGVRSAEDVILLMLILVVGAHSMLEYPLSYAYLLLPTGLAVGMLDMRQDGLRMFSVRRAVIGALLLAGGAVLGVTARDYFRVESDYLAMRFEFANLKQAVPGSAPEVLVLTQLGGLIKYARYEPHANMPPEELKTMGYVATLYPSAGIVHKYAAALAWNGRPDEAGVWLKKMCVVVRPEQCAAVRRAWIEQSKTDAVLQRVVLPQPPVS